MSDNIFGHIFKARQIAFGINVDLELEMLKNNVRNEITEKRICDSLRFVMFKITNKCNSYCVYCGYSAKNRYSEYRKSHRSKEERISTEEIKILIDQAADLGALAIAYNGGEPLLREDIADIILYSNNNRVLPILMTNGLLLPMKWEQLGEAGLKYVMISLDSLVDNISKLQRGVTAKRIRNGLDAAIRMRGKYGDMIIHITAVVTRYNINELCDLARFARKNNIWLEICAYHHMLDDADELSVDDALLCDNVVEKLKSMKLQGYPISTSNEYFDHLTDFCVHKIRKPVGYKCLVGYNTLHVDGYLNIRPCWDTSFNVVGNLRTNTLQDVWRGQSMQEFRRKMLFGQCDGCWNMCNEVTSLINE